MMSLSLRPIPFKRARMTSLFVEGDDIEKVEENEQERQSRDEDLDPML